jgi:hypothetical protein
MDKIARHLEKLEYVEYSENLNIKAELYLRKKVKEMFGIDTDFSSEVILEKIEKYINRDENLNNLIQKFNKLFPRVKFHQESDYHISFTLKSGSFYQTEYQKRVNELTYLSGNKFSNKNLISLIANFNKLYQSKDIITVYDIKKPLKCVILNDENLPSTNLFASFFDFSKYINSFGI